MGTHIQHLPEDLISQSVVSKRSSKFWCTATFLKICNPDRKLLLGSTFNSPPPQTLHCLERCPLEICNQMSRSDNVLLCQDSLYNGCVAQYPFPHKLPIYLLTMSLLPVSDTDSRLKAQFWESSKGARTSLVQKLASSNNNLINDNDSKNNE